MSMHYAIIAAASACGVLGVLAYLFAYILRRGPFRPLHVVALCLNLFAVGELAFSALHPAGQPNLLFALGCVGVATLAMSLTSLQQRRPDSV